MNTEALIQETLKEINGAPNVFKFAPDAEKLRSDPQKSNMSFVIFYNSLSLHLFPT